ncbi:hypothetical protein [Streptomyces sp. RKAG293]|uniref:hypothetical protein n=1 Tax=Streptomyces sp. RKAG293 TaxID=2893403 RepID=UPI0020340229|nr:hypothetical protein [Streptomyces sp. RKAG293]MCM2420746.1 hypothetical protein [Streptomyces sp. RKAG293]
MRPDPGKGELSGQTVETVLSEFDWVLAGSVPRVVRALPDVAAHRGWDVTED